MLCASLAALAGDVEPPDLTARIAAAERLFALPAYRLLATRQIQEGLKFLPEPQYRKALEALDNPRVVQALRGMIVRSMAHTYSAEEINFLAAFLAAPQARAFVAGLPVFEAQLTRELIAASLTDPTIGEILLGR